MPAQPSEEGEPGAPWLSEHAILGTGEHAFLAISPLLGVVPAAQRATLENPKVREAALEYERRAQAFKQAQKEHNSEQAAAYAAQKKQLDEGRRLDGGLDESRGLAALRRLQRRFDVCDNQPLVPGCARIELEPVSDAFVLANQSFARQLAERGSKGRGKSGGRGGGRAHTKGRGQIQIELRPKPASGRPAGRGAAGPGGGKKVQQNSDPGYILLAKHSQGLSEARATWLKELTSAGVIKCEPMLKQANEMLEQIDVVGTVERFSESMLLLCAAGTAAPLAVRSWQVRRPASQLRAARPELAGTTCWA